MDTDDMSYLSYLNDKPQSLLLQNTDEALGVHYSSLNVEQMFTDIPDGTSSWAIDGLPILMNNSFISEDQTIESCLEQQDNNLNELYSNSEPAKETAESLERMEDPEILSFPLDVASKSLVTTNGLFLANDVLLQFNLKNDELAIEETDKQLSSELSTLGALTNKNQELYTLSYETPHSMQVNTAEPNHEGTNNEIRLNINGNTNILNVGENSSSNEVIQLLNHDGTIITINKPIVTPTSKVMDVEKEKDIAQIVENMYEPVAAFKCTKCNHICESRLDIIKHILVAHKQLIAANISKLRNIELRKKAIINQKILKPAANGETQMKSLLNINNKKPNVTKCHTVFLCSVCSVTCTNTEELKNHMINVHKLVGTVENQENNSTATPTETDGKTNTSSKVLHKNLVQSQQKAKKIKCSVKGCVARFSQDAIRLRHEKCHVDGQKKQFKCTVCNKLFSIWRICSLHIWKCHKIDVGLLSCPMCNNYKSLSPHSLLNHMATHTSEYPFVCSYCGKKFKQMSQLRNHQITHREHKDDLPNWAQQQKCDQCGNYFSSSKSLKKHIQQVHNKFKPFICNICGHNTTRKAMLQLHLRQHTGEKPHKCTICPYSTGDHNSLRRHMMRHNGSAKYSCPHCDYKCIQSSSYKVHITKKHPGMSGAFVCSLCSFKFVNEIAFNNHMQEHRKEKEKNEANANNKNVNEISVNGNNRVPGHHLPKPALDVEDDETQNCFLPSDHIEDTVDTGGITIPADSEI